MSRNKYDLKIEKIWDNANDCYCGYDDCHPNNHKLCGICNEKILYGSHEREETQLNSQYAWNIDHIIPKSKGGTNRIDNLQAVHITCNQNKGNK